MKRIARTGRVLTLVALLTSLGFTAFDDLIALAVGTAHRDEHHVDLLYEKASVWHTRRESANLKHYRDTHPKAIGSPPPVIIFTRGRRRTVDTSGHFCPDPDCAYCGWFGRGNIRSNRHPGGQTWRQLQCVSCQGYFYETHGTIFHGKRSSPELMVHVIACLAEGLGIRGTARVFEIDANAVLHWLMEAAEQLQAFSAYFPHDLRLHQAQLDELYAVLSTVRDGQMSEAEGVCCTNRIEPALPL
jgi:transposase-like protein